MKARFKINNKNTVTARQFFRPEKLVGSPNPTGSYKIKPRKEIDETVHDIYDTEKDNKEDGQSKETVNQVEYYQTSYQEGDTDLPKDKSTAFVSTQSNSADNRPQNIRYFPNLARVLKDPMSSSKLLPYKDFNKMLPKPIEFFATNRQDSLKINANWLYVNKCDLRDIYSIYGSGKIYSSIMKQNTYFNIIEGLIAHQEHELAKNKKIIQDSSETKFWRNIMKRTRYHSYLRQQYSDISELDIHEFIRCRINNNFDDDHIGNRITDVDASADEIEANEELVNELAEEVEDLESIERIDKTEIPVIENSVISQELEVTLKKLYLRNADFKNYYNRELLRLQNIFSSGDSAEIMTMGIYNTDESHLIESLDDFEKMENNKSHIAFVTGSIDSIRISPGSKKRRFTTVKEDYKNFLDHIWRSREKFQLEISEFKLNKNKDLSKVKSQLLIYRRLFDLKNDNYNNHRDSSSENSTRLSKFYKNKPKRNKTAVEKRKELEELFYKMLCKFISGNGRSVSLDSPIDPIDAVLMLVTNPMLQKDYERLQNGEPIGFDSFDNNCDANNFDQNYSFKEMHTLFDKRYKKYFTTSSKDSLEMKISEKLPESLFTSTPWKRPITLRYFAARTAKLLTIIQNQLCDDLYLSTKKHKDFKTFAYARYKADRLINSKFDLWIGKRDIHLPYSTSDSVISSQCNICNFSQDCQYLKEKLEKKRKFEQSHHKKSV
ncbi:hydrolase activity protein [[Candida] boidinii]|nr:hydrolase activity protein [[Candida] boidinii]